MAAPQKPDGSGSWAPLGGIALVAGALLSILGNGWAWLLGMAVGATLIGLPIPPGPVWVKELRGLVTTLIVLLTTIYLLTTPLWFLVLTSMPLAISVAMQVYTHNNPNAELDTWIFNTGWRGWVSTLWATFSFFVFLGGLVVLVAALPPGEIATPWNLNGQ
jgi:hypothetical protein